MAAIRLVDVRKAYARDQPLALNNVNLEIDAGELFVLLGPSGCGKSTLLRLIAGLEEATAGELWLGDRLANYDPPGDRDAAMVFQNYALYPHMSVARNIEFPLRMSKQNRRDRERAAEQTAKQLGLEGLTDRKVGQLSGGQRQRVAVGRALVRNPAILLMDEPLSNLDALLRVQTREQLVTLHRELGTTIVYVTHDQVEAMTMGDRIAVMDDGEIVQVGTPEAVYQRPATRFVAQFIGNPPMNLVEGRITAEDGRHVFESQGLTVDIGAGSRTQAYGTGRDGANVTLGVRPERVKVVPGGTKWNVELVENLGPDRIVVLSCGGERLRARAGHEDAVRVDERVDVELTPTAIHLFDEQGRAAPESGPNRGLEELVGNAG